MNPQTSAVKPVMLAAMFFLLVSCQKTIDILRSPQNGLTDYRACNIKQITVVAPFNDTTFSTVYTFTYDAVGNPLTVKNTDVGTGNPNVVFKYDKYGRMTEMIRPYGNNIGFETWTKFFYNNRDQIVRDTQYIFGNYVDSVAVALPENSYWVHRYEYDALNRISILTDTFYSPSHVFLEALNSNYQYNSRGNLGEGFDNYLSILRTNRTWMFLSANYSINNDFTATAYNEHGLPLSFDAGYQLMQWVIEAGGTWHVEYDCK